MPKKTTILQIKITSEGERRGTIRCRAYPEEIEFAAAFAADVAERGFAAVIDRLPAIERACMDAEPGISGLIRALLGLPAITKGAPPGNSNHAGRKGRNQYAK